ncbi:RagB/SusD family nutrient uptake outer membrane protein [Persicobacter psychrovividus]|uniref:Membrane protein n=1 Tax=Persicobacter psychrovividus TaxID=387638 RepID=A0ABM7VC99_9BACT|nr:membrane protein [Persicobacter psychrovividus]
MKLKNIFCGLLAAFMMSGLSSCSDFLTLTPPSSIGENNFFENTEEVESAVIGVYDGLQELTNIAWSIEGIVDDNTFPGTEGFYAEMNAFTFDPFTGFFYDYWRICYSTINRANMVLENIEVVEEGAKRDQLKGEVLFIRAYVYHQMVQIYGSSPLILKTIGHADYAEMANTPEADIYAQVIADLKEAATLLPDSYSSDELGRATAWSAKGILAKAYLSSGDDVSAKTLLKEIMDSGNFKLQENYKEVFEVEMNNEILFAVRYVASDNEHQTFSYTFSSKGEFGGVMATTDILNTYEDGDLRKDASVGEDGGKMVVDKYNSVGISNEQSGVDWVALRYADVILLYAELLANEGMNTEAVDIVNQIRTRAGLAPKTFATQQELIDGIALERRLELAFEGHRWFDLKRYGNAIETIKAYLESENITTPISDHHLLFPIPNREINLADGNLRQNDGY